MLERAGAAGVPFSWITGDSVHDADHTIRRWAEQNGRGTVLAVTSGQRLGFRPVTTWIEDLPEAAWQRLSAGDGAKGPRLYDRAHLPCRGAEPGFQDALLVRRSIAEPTALTSYLTHAPEVRRLLWALVCRRPPRPAAALRWSAWRRRHQQRARRAHWHTRTRRDQTPAVVLTCAGTRGGERSVLTIYGRANSSNVMKVLWACEELGTPFERVDAGGAFGRTRDPDMLAKNPMALIPTIETEDGFSLFESHAILHYLTDTSPNVARVVPADVKRRAKMHQWMDWLLSALTPAMTPVFFGHVRIPPEKRDHAAITAATVECGRLWAMAEAELSDGRDHLCGDFSLADIACAPHLHRWQMLPVEPRPDLPRLTAWHARLRARPGFAAHLDGPIT